MLGGTVIDFAEWEIEHNGIYEAGTIRLTVPAEFAKWSWWTQQTEILIDVYVGEPADSLSFSIEDLTQVMTVRIDSLRLMPGSQSIQLVGRDLTALLIDQKNDQKYPNMTSSAIATMLAQKVGLTPQVQPTTGLVGNFYTADHVRLSQQETMWTLLTYLAQHEGVQCFVLGRTLYFGNWSSALSNEPYLIQVSPPTPGQPWVSSNAEDLDFEHDLTLAQDVSVRVRSYHGAKGAAFSATATASKTVKRLERDADLAQSSQPYDFTFPGLTQAQCQAKAQELLTSISQHELKLNAKLPADTTIYPWTPIQVQGTATLFDTTYQVVHVRRAFDVESQSYSMDVSGKTTPTQQTVTLS